MTLRELIRLLRIGNLSTNIENGFMFGHSNRGYTGDLGLEPCKNTTIGDMIEFAEWCDGQTFSGWKSGEFTMSLDSVVHLSERGKSGEPITVTMALDWVDESNADR